MSEPRVPCPGCRHPLKADQEICDSCLRPRDELEIEMGREALRREAARRAALPRKIALWGVVAAMAAGLIVRRDLILPYFSGITKEISGEYAKTQEVGKAPKPLTPEAQRLLGAVSVVKAVATGAPPPDAPASGSPTVSIQLTPGPVPAPAAVPKRVRRPVPPETPEAAHIFRIYGIVYDIVTAEPLEGARVVFLSPDKTTFGAMTDDQGLFVIDTVGAPGGTLYMATVEAPGVKGQTGDSDPPYFEREPEQRRQAAAELAPEELGPQPVRVGGGLHLIVLDLVVLRK